MIAELPDLSAYLREWSDDLIKIRQNRPLGEVDLIKFSKSRGLAVSGVVTGDPGLFTKRGWLPADAETYNGKPAYHPFRFYVVHAILRQLKLGISASTILNEEAFIRLVRERVAAVDPREVRAAADLAKRVVDLVILLEPLYWPPITGRLTWGMGLHREEVDVCIEAYRHRALPLIQQLDPAAWGGVHETLRHEAGWMDSNSELYLFLRMSTWDQRKRLTGSISGALWLRHMAEVIRRAFEDAHGVEWLEEDQGSSHWKPQARKTWFGFERPLDDEEAARPYVAFNFGYFTGSIARWYVEGDTEYYAILEVIPEPARMGIELVNLRGNIDSNRDNVALKLRDMLSEDRKLRRFSFISLDGDVAANVRTLRRQISAGNVVGFITLHQPDFETANYATAELVEIAAQLDEANGESGDPVRQADWSQVKSGRAFEEKYIEVSRRRPRSLKGAEWGRALAVHALRFPHRADDHRERPFLKEVQSAFNAHIASYDLQRDTLEFDPETFELRDVDEAC